MMEYSLKVQKWPLAWIVPSLLIFTVFTLPLSSTGKSMGLGLSVLAILSQAVYRNKIVQLINSAWCKLALGLFAFVLIACLWSPASLKEQLFVIEKYSKLLYLPILAVGFSYKNTRNYSLMAFIGAMLITCLLALIKFYGLLPALAIDPDFVFRNHIMTGLMVAFASYLALLFAYQQRNLVARYGYLLIALVDLYYILFINSGRTGYAVELLLLIIFSLQILSRKQAILSTFIISSLFIGCYLQNVHVQERVNSIAEQVQGYKQGQETSNSSIGFRLQFHDFAKFLFIKHPLVGNGTGSFTYYFSVLNPVPAWGHRLLEPHSQYWLILAELGIVGLALFLIFLWTLFKATWCLPTTSKIALSMLVIFIIGNFTDSLLFYSGSGYFFLLIMAICLGENIEHNA